MVISFILVWTLASFVARAELDVVTTTTTMKALVEEVGGDRVKVNAIAKGPQDPHFIEAKPSYMILVKKADLVVSNGLELEIGWLPNIIQGGRNPKVQVGEAGNFEAGKFVHPIEIPEKVDRAEGDVHPMGNPHFALDPQQVVLVVEALVSRLSQILPGEGPYFKARGEKFVQALNSKSVAWKNRVKASKIENIVTYHKTLNYFLKAFGLNWLGSLEPKPGVPPSAKHIMELVDLLKKTKNSCILSEAFFEHTPAERLQSQTGVPFFIVPTEVESVPEVKNYMDLIEKVVVAIEDCSQKLGKK